MTATVNRGRDWREWLPVALAALLVVCAIGYYSYRLTAWQAYDDEGGYMYASWRISLGEVPYRDFLTPQLPVFLYPGALVMKLFDGSVAAFRAWAMIQTLVASVLLWAAVSRLYGRWTATIALTQMLVDRTIFWAARFFRPEPPMLLFGMAGFLLLILARQRDSRALMVATGAAFGLATMSKLFGGLLIFGVGLWLLYEGIVDRAWRRMFTDGLLIAAGYAGVVVIVVAIGLIMSPEFVAYVLGHHLRQGAGISTRELLGKTWFVYREYITGMPICFGMGVLGLILALGKNDRLKALFAMQLPTVLAFLLMTRGLGQRHLTYLMPSVAASAAVGMVWFWRKIAGAGGRRARALAATVALLFVLVVAMVPHMMINENVRAWGEDDTPWWREFLQAEVRPDQTLVADYPGLNFVSRRASTRLAAGISGGAASSGQITGADIIEEIEASDVPIVLLNVAQGAHQFVAFVDFGDFKEYLQTQYHLLDRHVFDFRLIEIYCREDLWTGSLPMANFGGQLVLTGAEVDEAYSVGGGRFEAAAGLRWQATVEQMPFEYNSSLRVLDDQGNEWGLGSKKMVDIDNGIWYDEEGHPLAVLYPTTEWDLHEQTVQHQEIPVDRGTPPGTYRVALRVHPEGQWNGLPAYASDGAAVGYDVMVGDLVVPAPDANAAPDAYDMDEPLEIHLLDDVSIWGRRAIVDAALPGDVVDLRLLWSWRGETARDAELTMALQDAAGNGPVELTVPMLSSGWRDVALPEGDRLSVEAYNVAIPRDAEAGTYDLRLKLRSGGGDSDWVTLSEIVVPEVQRASEVPTDVAALGATFGDGLVLAAAQARGDGASVRVDLAWHCEETVDTRYTVFCHMTSAEGGMLAQADVTPGGGLAPTTSWIEGQVVQDTITLALPEGTSLDGLRVLVGMYDPLTGLRLTVADVSGASIGDHVALDVE